MTRRLVVLLTWVTVTFLGLVTPAGAIESLDGTYLHVRDSDGTTPKDTATVSITFKPNTGGVSMRAVQPGETVTDSGSYAVSGDTITIRFREMEWTATRQAFSFDGCTLVLPFKALSGSPGPGGSTWTKQSSQCEQKRARSSSLAPSAPGPQTSTQTGADAGLAAAPKAPPANRSAQRQSVPKTVPQSNKPTCEACSYVPCIKAMMAQKQMLKDVYGRLADKYAKFYTAVDANETRTPMETIDRAVWDRSSGGRLGGLADLMKAIDVFLKDAEAATAAARAPKECGIDPDVTLQMSTHEMKCETQAAPEVEAALPCAELWQSAVRHEDFHRQACEKRQTAGENHGPIFLTPYGMAKGEIAAYEQEIQELTQLLQRAEKRCRFTCRCGGKKYPTAEECRKNCRVGLGCPLSAANSCMVPDGPDGKPPPISPAGPGISGPPLR
jgi:hypothetical protein